MSTENKTPEQKAESYAVKRFDETYAWGAESLGALTSINRQHGEHKKEWKRAFLAGYAQARKDFIANELRGWLEKARGRVTINDPNGPYVDYEYEIDELMEEAEGK